jgi:glyceraldehyde 3-phosphate dehydrogenase
MSTNIAINGMGRIGRMVLRIALHNENFNVVAMSTRIPSSIGSTFLS